MTARIVGPTVIAPKDLTSATLPQWIEATVRLDEAGWPLLLVGNCDPKDPLDGLAMAAFCAARTRQIGLCAAVDPLTVEPFTLARGLATLDHMSGGRAAWRLVGSEADPKRSCELVEVVRKLLTSWAPDALIENVDDGMLSHADRVHPIAHEGAYFAVEGPLNVPRPPQGRVPLVALSNESAVNSLAELLLNDETMLHVSLEDLAALSDMTPTVTGETLIERLGGLQ